MKMTALKKCYFSVSTYYGDKVRNLEYLNRGIVFVLDLLLSSIGTLCALWLVWFVHGKSDMIGSVGYIIVLSAIISAFLFFLSKSYKTIIRFSTLRELNGIFFLLIIKYLILSFVIIWQGILNIEYVVICGMSDIFISSFLMISYRVLIVNIYSILCKVNKPANNVLVYGDSDYAALFASQMNNNEKIPYKAIGILSRIHRKKGYKIAGLKVYTWDEDLDKFLLSIKQDITHIIFPSYADFNAERGQLVYKCMEHNIQMLIGGEIHPLDKQNTQQIKNIEIEDLLQREEIKIDTEVVSEEVRGKVVLVTGAAGSIGSEISTQLAGFGVKHLILLDIAETPLHNLELDMRKRYPDQNITFILSDVRSDIRMKNVFEQNKPDFVFHAAAYKHVPIIEDSPCEGVLTNIGGTMNIARQSLLNKVEKFVMISTDKAVNPTSVMGATKRIAELYIQGLNNNRSSYTQFITVRFGNVLGSNGSVIPLFRKQIAGGGPVTVTHPEMIRYFMTISEACRLVLQAATMGKRGEIFIFDMGEQVKIDNLARKMILLSGLIPDEDIKIEYTGLRPGEKLYEELLTKVESTQITKNKKIRIAPADKIDEEKLAVQIINLMGFAEKLDIMGTVQMMKQIVPEFKSNNSEFEMFDKEELIIQIK